MSAKPVRWVGCTREDLRSLPGSAQREIGYQLWQVQQGLDPDDWKPMPSIGMGVREIRVHTALEHRVIYVAKFSEAVYVLHLFEKRSQATRWKDLNLARARLGEVLRARKVGS